MTGAIVAVAYAVAGLLTARRVYVRRVRSGEWDHCERYHDSESNIICVLAAIPLWPAVCSYLLVTSKPVRPAAEVKQVQQRIAELERELGVGR